MAFAEWVLPPDATVLAVTSTNWMGASCSFTAVMPEGSVDGMLRDSHVTAPLERGRTVFQTPADRSRIADGPRTWSAEEVLPRTPARPYPLVRKIVIDLSDPGTAVVHVWAWFQADRKVAWPAPGGGGIVDAVEIVLHDDVAAFARLARPLLDADPLRHTIALGALDAMCRGGAPAAALLTVHEAGEVAGAALRSPGWPTLVSAVPPRLAPAVERALAEADPWADGASGPLPEAEAFAAARVARTGCGAEPAMRMRLFALDVLAPPRGVPGAPRHADEDDVGLLARWRRAFEVDTGHGTGADDLEEQVARSLRLGAGEILWEVEGTPVAQASAKPVIAGASRIGPVYTPPERRGRGYAAAVTAAASQWALDAGAHRVLLFTDLANPTTNRLYPRIGYRAVHDAVELRFGR